MKTELGRPLSGDRVHFVGIGGVGMAALAELLMALGYAVSGSDLKHSRTVAHLIGLGADVKVGRHEGSSVDGADHVVFSNAVPSDNPELVRGGELGAEVMSRADLLGRIFNAGRGIAVAGTHGKTTTSSMLARALDAAGYHPSFVIGGDLNDVGSGATLGTSDVVVAEADEAFASFLTLAPELAVVTNVDTDHLEHYADQAAIDAAFIEFLGNRKTGGWAVLCAPDEGIARIRDRISDPVATYGFAPSECDLVVGPEREVTWKGTPLGTLTLTVPGRHNVLNACAALTACLVLGADPTVVIDALGSFGGVDRRFSVRGEVRGVVVVDDYAHNPRKVAASLSAAKEAYPGRRIVALFQPHLYSRTAALSEDFGGVFDDADIVVVTDVYGAREEPLPGVSGRLVSDAIRRNASRVGDARSEGRVGDARSEGRVGDARSEQVVAIYVPRLEEAAGFVAGLAEPGDVVLTIGAGDVTTAAPRILSLLTDAPGP